MMVLGNHLLAEYYNCRFEKINDLAFIEKHLIFAAKACGATVVETKFHRFSPQGLSGVVVLKESHITIHTWPEYGYAAVDIFTCGSKIDPMIAYDYLKIHFEASEDTCLTIPRGDKKQFERKFNN